MIQDALRSIKEERERRDRQQRRQELDDLWWCVMIVLLIVWLILLASCSQSSPTAPPPYEPPPQPPADPVFKIDLRLEPESPWFEYVHQNQGGDYTAWKFSIVLQETGGAAGQLNVLGLTLFSDVDWATAIKVCNWNPGAIAAGETREIAVDDRITGTRVRSFVVWYPWDDGHGTTRPIEYKYRVVWNTSGTSGRGVELK